MSLSKLFCFSYSVCTFKALFANSNRINSSFLSSLSFKAVEKSSVYLISSSSNFLRVSSHVLILFNSFSFLSNSSFSFLLSSKTFAFSSTSLLSNNSTASNSFVWVSISDFDDE